MKTNPAPPIVGETDLKQESDIAAEIRNFVLTRDIHLS